MDVGVKLKGGFQLLRTGAKNTFYDRRRKGDKGLFVVFYIIFKSRYHNKDNQRQYACNQ